MTAERKALDAAYTEAMESACALHDAKLRTGPRYAAAVSLARQHAIWLMGFLDDVEAARKKVATDATAAAATEATR